MLIEIVVAIGIIGLVLIGVSDLMTRSSAVVTFQKQRDEALAIIKKKLTDYKVERDTNPDSFYLNAENAVIDPCKEDTIYKCQVTMEKTADTVYIMVTVEWQDGGRTYTTSLSESLAKSIK